MDVNTIDYQTMLATKESASWMFWSMVATFISALATAFAATVAVRTINGWKKQETAKEIKNINLSVFRFQTKIQQSRYEFKSENKDVEEAKEAMSILMVLDGVYECTITMHNKEFQDKSSDLYLNLSAIYSDFVGGKANRNECVDRLLDLRKSNAVLRTFV